MLACPSFKGPELRMENRNTCALPANDICLLILTSDLSHLDLRRSKSKLQAGGLDNVISTSLRLKAHLERPL